MQALRVSVLGDGRHDLSQDAHAAHQYTSGNKAKRILLPVRHLQQWIEHNILLELASAPFSKEDAVLVPEAGACLDCSKRTGHNVLLFEGLTHADRSEMLRREGRCARSPDRCSKTEAGTDQHSLWNAKGWQRRRAPQQVR